jgi:hypothetical protein
MNEHNAEEERKLTIILRKKRFFVFHYCSLVSYICFKINKMQTVKILVNNAVFDKSVEHENPAVSGEILLAKIRMTQSEKCFPTLPQFHTSLKIDEIILKTFLT